MNGVRIGCIVLPVHGTSDHDRPAMNSAAAWTAADGYFSAFDFKAGRIHALGLTYADHIRETGERAGNPAVFWKRCVPRPAPHVAAVPSHRALAESIERLDPALAAWLLNQFDVLPALLDYEVEIGMVLFDDVALSQLDDPAFTARIGLFVANDLTARSVQITGEGSVDKMRFWSAAKSFPDFLPVGGLVWCPSQPSLDRLPELVLETRVNGQIRQSASMQQLLYTPREMLRFAARHAPDNQLRMHDVVLTGTPAGIALTIPRWKRRLAALLPRRQRVMAALRANLDNPRFLQPGDEIAFSAGWLGSQTLRIAAAGNFNHRCEDVPLKKLKIIMPIPNNDFDPTEAAVSWRILRTAGHDIDFATADGKRGYADPLMISGEGLDPWGWIPGLRRIRCIGLFLRADRFGRQAYRALQQDARFLNPKRYHDLSAGQYDAMVLPGGHASGMKQYLDNATLQAFVADFFDTVDLAGRHKPVAAICHGVLLAARSISANTQKSVLHGRKTTALTWKLERSAWHLSKYLARFWDAEYYRTYHESKSEPVGYWGVEQEIKRALAADSDFLDVPKGSPNYLAKTSGMVRDRPGDSRPAWVVRDGNYLSARWPGDVHTFAQQFVDLLAQYYGTDSKQE